MVFDIGKGQGEHTLLWLWYAVVYNGPSAARAKSTTSPSPGLCGSGRSRRRSCSGGQKAGTRLRVGDDHIRRANLENTFVEILKARHGVGSTNLSWPDKRCTKASARASGEAMSIVSASPASLSLAAARTGRCFISYDLTGIGLSWH